MNLKLIGAILCICACGCCGFLTAAHHARNIRLLENLLFAVDYMICELQYRATPLPLLCRQAGGQCSGRIRQILFAFADELDAQLSPNAGICMSSALDRTGETDSKISIAFQELGKQLGRFDLAGQIQGLENCREHCAEDLLQMKSNKDSRIRSYQTLGLCAGAAVAILLV